MVVIKFNPKNMKNPVTRDEICEALKGERAFIENDIIVSDAPERGERAFDLILGGEVNRACCEVQL